MTVKPRHGAAAPDVAGVPQEVVAAGRRARGSKIDRAAYEIVRTIDRLEAWVARALRRGRRSRSTSRRSAIDPMQAPLCGIALAVAPNEACYVPLAHRKGGNGERRCRGPVRRRSASGPDLGDSRARRTQATAGGPRRPQDRAEPEVRIAGVRGARHRDAGARGHHADVLRARRRPLRPFARCARAALLQSRRGRLQRRDRQRQVEGHLRQRRDRQGRALRRRGCRHLAAAVGGAEGPHGRRARDRRLRDAGASAAARCWRAWSAAASRSTGRCCRASRASSRSAAPRWKPKCASLPAIRVSIQARPSSSATSCSAR